MARFTSENEAIAREIISRYPVARSALIPLCHLAQEQDGHLTDDAMQHIGELLDIEAAEVLGTASFYEMFKRHPVGRYVVNVCTSISCFLMGGDELLEHAEQRLGIKEGGTTEDGLFSLEGYECIAACTEAPCLQIDSSTTCAPGAATTSPRTVISTRRASASPPTGRRASPVPTAADSRFGSATHLRCRIPVPHDH